MKAVPLENQTMLRSFISKSLLYLVVCLIWHAGALYAQDDSPSICDCAKYAKTDPQLLSRCEQKFDYNSMTNYERLGVEGMIKACNDPEICDCANLGVNDSIISRACAEKYNEDSLDEDEYADYLETKKSCIKYSNKPPLKTICDCLEPHDKDDIEFSKCKGIWNISNLSSEERQKFVSEITGCIDHKDDPDYTLSLCDCLNTSDDDLEFKERCIKKFDLNAMTDEQITIYKAEIKDCHLYSSGASEFEIICDCIKQERETGSMSAKCESTLKGLEDKYKNLSPEDMKEFVERLMECLGGL